MPTGNAPAPGGDTGIASAPKRRMLGPSTRGTHLVGQVVGRGGGDAQDPASLGLSDAEQDALLVTLLDHVPGSAVLVLDADRRIRLARGPLLADLRFRAGRVLGRTPTELLPATMALALDGPIERAFAGERTVDEIDFGRRVFRLHAVPLFGKDAGVAQILLVAQDITGYVEARKRSESLQRLTNALSAALTPVAVAEVVLAEGRAVVGAAAGAVVMAIGGGDLLEVLHAAGYRTRLMRSGQRFSLNASMALADAVRTRAPVLLAAQTDWEQRYPAIAPLAAREGYVGYAALPLVVEDRALGALVFSFSGARHFSEEDGAFLRTVADQCAQALERSRLYEVAQETLRVRSALLSALSHDLRTPLTTIKGAVQFVRRWIDRPAPSTVRVMLDMLARVERAAAKMSAMLEELADLARLDSGEPLELVRSATDLVALARASVHEQAALTSGHTFQVVAAEETLVGEWDTARLVRVLDNLLSNATKYSPTGGQILVRLARSVTDGRAWAELVVADQGLGIPAADLPRILERFYRAGNVTAIAGSGIGLAGARQIVEQHGGTIAIDSDEGRGTTVTIRLPLS